MVTYRLLYVYYNDGRIIIAITDKSQGKRSLIWVTLTICATISWNARNTIRLSTLTSSKDVLADEKTSSGYCLLLKVI